MPQPLISVIVPIYNVAAYLERCIESIRSQSYPTLELILVNDGSPDESPAICERYAAEDARIRLIHRPNGGLSAARNSGLEVATGDFIAYVDSDDWLEPGVLEACMQHFITDPELDCIGYGVRLVEDQTERILENHIPETARYYSREELLPSYVGSFHWTFSQTVCAKVYRRELVEGLRFHEGYNYEDSSYTLELLWRLRKYLLLDCLGYNYRKGRAGSITTRLAQQITLRSDALANLEDLIERNAADHELVRYANTMLYNMGLMYLIEVYNHKPLKRDYLASYLRYFRRVKERPLLPLPLARSLKRQLILYCPQLVRYLY